MSKELNALMTMYGMALEGALSQEKERLGECYNIIETALKEYETLKEYYNAVVSNREFDKEYFYKCVKTLKIIKEKNVCILDLKKTKTLKEYNCCREWKEELTQEEYNLLKEVLNYGI